jgi:type II secretion system protein N
MNRFMEKLRKAWHAAAAHGGVVLAGAGCFLLAFLLGFYLFFPTAAITTWLLAEIGNRTPLSVQAETLSLSPIFTLSGERATVTFDGSPASPIALDALRLSPLWATLLTGNPGLSIEAALLQGQLAASWRQGGDFAMQVEGMKLEEVPVNRTNSASFSGTLVKGEMRRGFPSKKTAENLLALEMDPATLTVLGQPLALGKVSVQGSGQGNSLRLASVTANGGDVAVTGSGSVLLGASAAASRISLDLALRPAATAPASLAALLELAARRQADGSYRLQLSGAPDQLALAAAAPPVTGQPRESDDE